MHLVILFGPPAVGKMTVGLEVARLTPYRLFHNHATIEPLLGIFDFGTPPFDRLKDEIRTRVIEEAIAHGLPGLVFTVVWALELPGDTAIVERIIAPAVDAGHPVDFVEYDVVRTRDGLARSAVATGTTLSAADTPVGFFAKLDPCSLLAPGDRLAPLNAALLAHLDEVHGTAFGALEAAPDVR